jgi:hypothetical protein
VPMPANPKTRPSPRLTFYGLTFRVLRSVALQMEDRACKAEPASTRQRRRPASLELETAQGGPHCPPATER